MNKKVLSGLFAITVVLSASAAGETVSFKDDFTGYSMLSGGEPNWAVHSGNWEFVNGTARQTDQMFNGGLLVLNNKSFKDCTIKLRFKPDGSERLVRAAGVVFRAIDCFNFYWIHFDSRNSQVVFARRTTRNSWLVVHRERGIKIKNNVWYTAEVSAVGKKITVKLNGKVVLEKEDGALKEGRVGLRSGMGVLTFDDFEVSGTPAEDKFVMTYENKEDKTSRRIEVPRVISSFKSGYFPVMVGLGGNKLGAVIRAGAGHVGIKGRLDWITSEDGGKTWSKPTVLVNSKWDDRNPAAFVTEDGRIVVLYSEATSYNEQGDFHLKYGTYDLYMTESTDGGKTWSPKKAIKFPGHVNSSVYGQGIILSNGDIIVPWYWKGGGFIRSVDGGRSWQSPQRIAACSEVAFVETAPQEILAIARQGKSCVILRSKDNGKTWSEPEPFSISGIHPATVIKLANGDILAAVGSRIRPYGIKVMISKDKGVTWKKENSAFISWDSGNTDSGYPSAVQLADGSVAIISYALGSKLLPVEIHSQCMVISPEVLKDLSK